jgi:hypothetical protein
MAIWKLAVCSYVILILEAEVVKESDCSTIFDLLQKITKQQPSKGPIAAKSDEII